MNNEEKKDLKKDIDCVGCRRMFFCDGKPRNVKLCDKYEPRKEQK